MAPKRSRQDAEVVSLVKPSTKQRLSQFLSTVPTPRSTSEAFSTMADFKRYSNFFHGREIAFGHRFNLAHLSTTRFQFKRMLVQSGLHSLAVLDQDLLPEMVWQFYSNINLNEDGLNLWVQG